MFLLLGSRADDEEVLVFYEAEFKDKESALAQFEAERVTQPDCTWELFARIELYNLKKGEYIE